MTLFQRAKMTTANLKMGFYGFAGSGKTFTATNTAIGLIQHMRKLDLQVAQKPIFFLDTETGSDWIAPKIEGADIELFTAKTRAFSDLLSAVDDAEQNASLLLVDSLSHFWTELTESYAKKMRRKYGLQFQDWAYLKAEWAKFTTKFINSNLHIIVCGRAGYEYDYFEEEGGKKQLAKTGVKMKAEGEMSYEPSLVVLMTRETNPNTNKIVRVANIMKDRSALLDGKSFKNPTFKSFLPHIKSLNLGGEQLGVDTSRTSEADMPASKRDQSTVQRKIVLNEIQDVLVLNYPGTSKDEKKAKLELLQKHFKASWTEIEEVMPLDDLRMGYDTLFTELTEQPSKYAHLFNQTVDVDDEIPHQEATQNASD